MIFRQADPGNSRLTKRLERKLVSQARGGSQEAARKLVDAHKDRLFAFVWRILRDHHESEEICQDTFLRAFASLDSFSPEYRFSTWLFTIGYRLCLNHLRRRKGVSGEIDFAGLPSNEPDAAEALAETEEARRLKNRIWEAVDELSVPQRAAILLFYREGLSCDEIAQTMEIPMATAKSHLHRARGRLRESLSYLVRDWSQVDVTKEAAS